MLLRKERRGAFTLCGLCAETDLASCGADLAGLWNAAAETLRHWNTGSTNRNDLYGLMWNTGEGRYAYLLGVAGSPERLPEGWVCRQVEAAEYAVLSVPAALPAVEAWTRFYETELPRAGLRPKPGHIHDFEYYPAGGQGDYELWTPVSAAGAEEPPKT